MKLEQMLTASRIVCRALGGLAVALLCGATATAQTQIYSQDFDSDVTANWVTNITGAGYSYADFYFDYSTVGVPSAPHSAGGTTRGLKLGANLGAGGVFPAGISVSPLNFGISDNFEMRFDMWLNYNKSGQGSTEVGGAGYGTAGTSAQVAGSVDSVFVGATTDGGSSADYRVYGPNYPGSYQADSHIIGSDPTSPLVYAAGSRNNTATYYVTNFPAQPVPEAQTNLFPRQTGLIGRAGAIPFKWHNVLLKKVGNVITYRIDGVLIATVDSTDAGTLAGTNILFNLFDINTGGSVDVDATNVLFALFDNVTISSLTNIVNVSATSPNASETGPTPGLFTLTRTAANGPLTVYYSVGGTATSGSDYEPLSGSVTFGPADLSADVTVTPIDDSISELPETVILTITDSTNYNGAGTAEVTIADNDTPTLNVSVVQPTMYEPYTNDFVRFRLQRLGDLNAPSFSANLSYSGDAENGVDFTGPTSIVVPSGDATVDLLVYPIDNSEVTGPRSFTVNVDAGSGYELGTTTSASGTIVDDEAPAATVLFSDPLTDPNDAGNWHITYGTGTNDNLSENYNVDFGYDITANNPSTATTGVLTPPPGGATHVLHVTCNKLFNPGDAGGVNVYYMNQAFSGDYAVRFDMNLVEGQDLAHATEGALFGIDHSGSLSNWWFGSGLPLNTNLTWASDGVWYYVASQGAADSIGDYHEYTGKGGINGNTGWDRISTKTYASFTDVFKNTPGPFTTISGTGEQLSGVPANATPLAFQGEDSWVNVEIKQIHNVVTLSMNKTVIFTYTNNTVWTNGYLMLGYADPYGGRDGASVGTPDAGVYYANLQVVSLTPPHINTVSAADGNITLAFSTPDAGDTADSFTLQSATSVQGPYTDVSPSATFTALGNGMFQAVAAQDGEIRFYRVHHK